MVYIKIMGSFLPESPRAPTEKEFICDSKIGNNVYTSVDEIDFLLKLQKTEDRIVDAENKYSKFESDYSDVDYFNITPVKSVNFDTGFNFTKIGNKGYLPTPKKYFNEDILNTVPKTVSRFPCYVDNQHIKESACLSISRPKYSREYKRCEIKKIQETAYCCRCRHSIKEKSRAKKIKDLLTSILVFISEFFLYQLPSTLILYSLALFLITNNCRM